MENLDVKYGAVPVLNKVSIRVRTGETVALIGPNGHGKSTLLNAIVRLIPIASGRILYKERDISTLSPQEVVSLGLSVAPQGDHLFNFMTVQENLRLGAYTLSSSEEVSRKLESVFAIFPRLMERRNQRVWSLSGGERRMVAVGRALMSDSSLLLLDEPSLGLAPKLVEEMYQKILEVKRNGVTILLAEQNINYTMDVADEICLLEEGQITRAGKPEAIFNDEYVKKVYMGL